jgi:DNA-directed RNA polymerase II subunit RPB1
MGLNVNELNKLIKGTRGDEETTDNNEDGKCRKDIDRIHGQKDKLKIKTGNDLADSKLPLLDLDSIVYTAMSREKMETISVCTVTNTLPNKKGKKPTDIDMYTSDDNRLGTIENNTLCSSCHKTNDECPGHYGKIDLPSLYIHPLFREPTIYVLQSICFRCFEPLLNRKKLKEIKYKNYARLAYIAKESKDEHHANCCHNNDTYHYFRNPTFKTGTGPRTLKGKVIGAPTSGVKHDINIFAEIKTFNGKVSETKDYVIKPVDAAKIIKNISDSDIKLLGFNGEYKGSKFVFTNHPRNFFVDFIPVIPPSARPYSRREGVRKDDFITKFYDDVLHEIQQYDSNDIKEESIAKILFYYSHIIDNSDKKYKKSTSDVIKSFKERLVGKQELIRGFIMGKRSDFTGRTVLGPNRDLEYGEIAPPSIMKKTLTVPEYITKYNIEYVRDLAESDQITCLTPTSGPLAGRSLRFMKNKHGLRIGYKIDRHSRNGDPIIFNRAPTLQKQSMSGYKIRFQNKLSVGIHISSTSPHNADFDGDEGNLHMIQTTQAREEVRTFMSGPETIMSEINSSPVSGIIYNGTTGGYLLSKVKELTVKQIEEGKSVMKYFNPNTGFDQRFSQLQNMGYDIGYMSGSSLISLLFPPDFWYNEKKKGGLKIRNGIIVEGEIRKANVGPSTNSVIQALYKGYGHEVTRIFITDATFLFNWYLTIYGFTVGISNCKANVSKKGEDVDSQINNNFKANQDFLRKKEIIISQMDRTIIELPRLNPLAGKIAEDDREKTILDIISVGEAQVHKAFLGGKLEIDGVKISEPDLLGKDNPMVIMSDSGSRGKTTDTSQVVALLGQQFVPNKRPIKAMNRGKRWMSSFHINDTGIASRGFCSSSYYEGLGPDEFFAHAMASRIGLAATAVGTADVGSKQRQIVKSAEDLVAQNDGSVRNQVGKIYQFSYGAGFSSSHLLRRETEEGSDYLTFINFDEVIGKINAKSGHMDEFYILKMMKQIFQNTQ